MIPREQNRNNKRTLGWKNFIPENFLEIDRYLTLTSYCNTIGQSNNAFSVLGFSWRENEDAIFWSFHPLADKTNNEHLPKPLFKVIRKSLLGTVKRATKTCIYFFFDIVENELMLRVLLPTNQTRVLQQIRSLQVAKICCKNVRVFLLFATKYVHVARFTGSRQTCFWGKWRKSRVWRVSRVI